MITMIKRFNLISLLLSLCLLNTYSTAIAQVKTPIFDAVNNAFKKADQLDLKDPSLAQDFLSKQYVILKHNIPIEDKLAFLSRLVSYALYLDNKILAIQYINQAYEVSPRLVGNEGIDILISHGTILLKEDRKKEGMDRIYQAIERAKASKDIQLLAVAYNVLAWHYHQERNIENSLRYYQKAFNSLEKLKDPTELAYLKTQMFNVYIDLHDAKTAINLLNSAIVHFKQNKMPFDEFMGLNSLATTYKNMTVKNHKRRIDLYQEMVALSSSLADSFLVYYAYIGLTDSFISLGDIKNANINWQRSQDLLKDFNDNQLQINHYLVGVKLAIAQKNTILAHRYLTNTNIYINEHTLTLNTLQRSEFLQAKIELSVLDNNFMQAFKLQNELLTLQRTQSTSAREIIRSRLKIQFDIQQQQLENKLLEKNQKINQIEIDSLRQSKTIQRGIILIGICFVIFLLLFVHRQLGNSQYLKMLANTDPLTNIPNRRAIFSFASKYIKQINSTNTGMLSIIIYDIDHFKSINDTFGHNTGDEVLINIAQVSKNQLRTNDLLGRIGGEEFLAVLRDTPLEHALDIAERLRDSIEMAQIDSDGDNIKVTASFGVVQYKYGIKNINTLYQQADALLYEAKSQGRNCIRATR